MPIDFTTTPLPTNGQARSAAALAAAFVNIRDTYNAHTNNTTPTDQHQMHAILGDGTLPLATARALIPSTAWVAVDMLAKAVKDIMGTANFTDAMPSSLAAIQGAINAHTIVAAPPTSIDWAAVTNTNTLDINKINQNLKVIPGGSPLRTVVKGMAVYNPLTGGASPKGDQTVTHPASPTAPGTFRYDGESIDAAGNVVLTVGTASSTPAFPVLPVGQRALGMVLIAANTDSTLIPAANITDLRGGETAFGGSSGGGGSTINHPYASFGSGGDVSTPSVDIPTVLEGGYLGTSTTINGINLGNLYLHTDMAKDIATDASLGDMMENFATQNLMALIRNGISGATVTIGADANNPVPMAIQGRRRKITAPVSATATGGAGVRYVIASCATANALGWTIIISASPAVSAYQMVVATVWFDGGTLQAGTAIDFAQLFSAPSTSLLMEGANAVGTIPSTGYPTLTGSGSFQAINGIPVSVFYLPKLATVDVRLNAGWIGPAASSSNQFRVTIDAIPEGMPIFVPANSGGGNTIGSVGYRRVNKLPAGIHSLTIQALVAGGQTLGVITDSCVAYLDFSY